ncbi:MAG: CAP domain-containing protein [Eubacteriales bacterium]|nr:CAP domain-containing protein [Eubacteriales bacterium]
MITNLEHFDTNFKKQLKASSAMFQRLLAGLLSASLLMGFTACVKSEPEAKLNPQTVKETEATSSAEAPSETSAETPAESEDLSSEDKSEETEETTEDSDVEAQVGDREVDVDGQGQSAVIIQGDGEPNIKSVTSLKQFSQGPKYNSAYVQRFHHELEDQAYQAELEAAAAAAAQAQAEAAAAAARLQQAQQAVAQAQSNSTSQVGVSSEGAAGIHDTYQGAMTIIALLNQYRQSMGIHALVNDAVMQEIALVRAPAVGNSYRNSSDATGHNHYGVFALTWIASVYGANSGLAENTGFFTTGTKTPEQIYTAFMNSPPHYQTMVNPNFTRVGIALYYDPVDNREYVVMNFGN